MEDEKEEIKIGKKGVLAYSQGILPRHIEIQSLGYSGSLGVENDDFPREVFR